MGFVYRQLIMIIYLPHPLSPLQGEHLSFKVEAEIL
jgi:hypothetical protein